MRISEKLRKLQELVPNMEKVIFLVEGVTNFLVLLCGLFVGERHAIRNINARKFHLSQFDCSSVPN